MPRGWAIAMQGDTVDRTIRNQRYRSWPAVAGLSCWVVFWIGLAYVVGRQLSLVPTFWVNLVFVLATTASFVLAGAIFDRYLPIRRLKLGAELRTTPNAKYALKDIQVIAFSPDPLEDYVEKSLPIQYFEVAIVRYKGRPLKLIVSFGDASRIREWAEQHGVAVDDPQKYTSRIQEPETRQ